ncbi:uncharacterized protein LOC102800579 [Saccoglossus kowalevskii]
MIMCLTMSCLPLKILMTKMRSNTSVTFYDSVEQENNGNGNDMRNENSECTDKQLRTEQIGDTKNGQNSVMSQNQQIRLLAHKRKIAGKGSHSKRKRMCTVMAVPRNVITRKIVKYTVKPPI